MAIDPKLYNAYMGLGQFEYYCGTLSGVLQFVLALPGNPDKGLAMLKECEDKASYAAWPCKVYRISLMLSDRHDYQGAEPELAALMARYPGNYQFARSVFEVLESGINTAALRRSAEDVLRRLDQGWEPPKHAGIDPQACRLTLAKAYLQAGEASPAAGHLKRLAEQAKGATRDEALALLKGLPAEAATPTVQPLSPTAMPQALSPVPAPQALSPAARPAVCLSCPDCPHCPDCPACR